MRARGWDLLTASSRTDSGRRPQRIAAAAIRERVSFSRSSSSGSAPFPPPPAFSAGNCGTVNILGSIRLRYTRQAMRDGRGWAMAAPRHTPGRELSECYRWKQHHRKHDRSYSVAPVAWDRLTLSRSVSNIDKKIMPVDIPQLLAFVVKNNVLDLQLSAGVVPMFRVDGV